MTPLLKSQEIDPALVARSIQAVLMSKTTQKLNPPRPLATAPPKKTPLPGSNQVDKWVSMLADPYGCTSVVRSPSACPSLGSKARIVHTEKIVAGDLNNGNFAVIARPSTIDPLVLAKKEARLPAIGFTKTFGEPFSLAFNKGDHALSGYMTYKNSSGGSRLVSDKDVGGQRCFTIDRDSTNVTTVTFVLDPSEKPINIRYGYYNALWTYGSIYRALPGVPVILPGSSTLDSTNVFLTDASGTLTPAEHTIKGLLYTEDTLAAVPESTSSSGLTSFVNPNLVDVAHVSNCRITAMSILCTNTAAATEDGGLLVSACTRQSLPASSGSIVDLMDNTMKLPETNRWQRSIVSDGAYAFYVPDDLESYEPHDYSSYNFHDNCVYVAGTMDPANGSVNVTVTWIVEFYTPVQLFERSVGPAWHDDYEIALRVLQMGRLASQNDAHESLTKRVASNVKRVLKWAFDNKEALLTAGQLAISLL